ncbi:MAG: murein biosynthesis integral membrane protein MurJ [Candidatus Shapirobacteria bacterium]
MGLKNLLANGRNLLSRRQSNIFSAALILAIAFGLSALLGILRDRLLYARFYACCASDLDAYNAAFRLPDLVFQLLVIGALSAAFIPIFSQKLLEDESEAFLIARSLGTFLFLAFIPLALIIFIFAPFLSSLITAGFNYQQLMVMADLTRIMIFAQAFFLFSNLTTGILQAHRRFIIPALSPLIYNLGIILGVLLLSGWLGIYGPAIGVLFGAAGHFLIQYPLTRQLGFRLKPNFSFHFPEFKRILRLMLPRSLTLGLSQIESTVILFFATGFAAGSLSLLYLAEHLSQLFSRIFGATIGQAALPSLSSLNASQKSEEFNKVFMDSLLQSLYLSVWAAIVLLVLRIPLVRLAFGAKGFPWEATLQTGRVLAILSPAVIAQSGSQIVTRGYYSLQDTRRPLYISLLSLAVTLLVSLFGIYVFGWGIAALVMAISLAAIVRFGVLLFAISRKLSGFSWQRLGGFTLKILIISLISAPVFWFLMRFGDMYFNTTRVWGLLLLTALSLLGGSLSYLWLSFKLDVREAKILLSLIKKMGHLPSIFQLSQEQLEKPKELISASLTKEL